MKESEVWKLILNWIEIKKVKKRSSFLENVALFNEQNEKLKSQGLKLYYKEEEKRSIETFFVITPYLIQMFRGVITEQSGTIHIEDYEMIRQISCDSVMLPNIIGRTVECENPIDAITPFISETSYVLNGMNRTIHYYQEKDVDGLYGRVIETKEYLKIGKTKQENVQKHEMVSVPCSDLESFDEITLIYENGKIIPVLKQYQSETCMIAIDLNGFATEVEKVYQLL